MNPKHWTWAPWPVLAAALPLFLAASTPREPEPVTPTQRRSAIPVMELHRGPRGTHRVALTFDAGGEAKGCAALIAALDVAHVRSTFFLSGQWMRKHPELVRALAGRGHELGNHTWSHRRLTQLGDATIRAELVETDALLDEYLSPGDRRWWRAPFGDRDARVLRIASGLGCVSVSWTLDSLDSVEPPKTREFLIARITRCTEAQLGGAIILMHVGEPATAEALPEILHNLQQRKFEMVTVSGLLDSKASGAPAGETDRNRRSAR